MSFDAELGFVANTWDQLRALRERDQRPLFPVVIFARDSESKRAAALNALGCMAIEIERGASPPVELLVDLRVYLLLGGCDRGYRFIQFTRRRGVVARFESWCPCAQQLEVDPWPCGLMREWDALPGRSDPPTAEHAA